ncbi:hypothetical protein Sjap_016425 [Stephania japonica]|uniref:Uncharacterized protein n=1 Tax=Stephania japonica TaxID=461633 RepID=A0AAP0IL16_9MAGN
MVWSKAMNGGPPEPRRTWSISPLAAEQWWPLPEVLLPVGGGFSWLTGAPPPLFLAGKRLYGDVATRPPGLEVVRDPTEPWLGPHS